MDRFCDRLNEAIERAELSPAELSRRTGIGEGAISCYRNGSYKAGQKNVQKLAVALGVSIPWLMGLDVDMAPSSHEVKQALIDRVLRMDPEQLDKLSRLLDIVEGL
ncbi:MAG: helix-turn-helix transcriptional regulator [Oscillospiraceae bacterium]|nr:helix-turn-helix transcriptional regulator [Oscillospiraceae bacterium]